VNSSTTTGEVESGLGPPGRTAKFASKMPGIRPTAKGLPVRRNLSLVNMMNFISNIRFLTRQESYYGEQMEETLFSR
jgi:hypothetical protein